jgi:hypothetical protein
VLSGRKLAHNNTVLRKKKKKKTPASSMAPPLSAPPGPSSPTVGLSLKERKARLSAGAGGLVPIPGMAGAHPKPRRKGGGGGGGGRVGDAAEDD